MYPEAFGRALGCDLASPPGCACGGAHLPASGEARSGCDDPMLVLAVELELAYARGDRERDGVVPPGRGRARGTAGAGAGDRNLDSCARARADDGRRVGHIAGIELVAHLLKPSALHGG